MLGKRDITCEHQADESISSDQVAAIARTAETQAFLFVLGLLSFSVNLTMWELDFLQGLIVFPIKWGELINVVT